MLVTSRQRKTGMLHTRQIHRVGQKFAASSRWFPIHSCSLWEDHLNNFE